VGDRPMIWKEVFAEPGPRRHPLARIVLGVLVGLSFLPVGMILYNLLDEAEYAPMTAADFSWRLSMAMSIWVRIVGTAVASLLLLHVAVRAASSIGVERERQTLDSLLTTPLSTDDILHGKLLGSVLGQRWAWLWLAAIYLVGVIGGGVNILALPLILGAWLIFAMFFGVLGLWFAAVSRTTTRAVVSTVLAALALGGGCSCPMIFLRSGSGFGPPWELMKWALMFQSFGLTPSITLAALAFRLTELDPSRYGPFFWSGSFLGEVVICILLGLFVWGVATKVLWSALTIRFAQRVRPTPIRRRPR
jgi:ABC-type Na+ efflux pump permease subunit